MSGTTWVYNQLTGDTEIAAKVGSRIYRDSAPEGTQFPFLVYQLIDSRPVYNAFKDALMHAEHWQIKATDKGHDYTNVEAIAQRVHELLHKQVGSGVIASTLEMKLAYPETDSGEAYKTIILDFMVYSDTE